MRRRSLVIASSTLAELLARHSDEFCIGVRPAAKTPAAVGRFGEQHPNPLLHRLIGRRCGHDPRQLGDHRELLLAVEAPGIREHLHANARVMNTRCPAGSSVTCAFIRFAMKRSSSGLIARSCVATTYHDGTVLQAGATVSGSPSALPAIGFCAVANARARVGGKPLANTSGYFAASM